MKKQGALSRRTALRGLGGITIGFPLLEEMIPTTALGSPRMEVPTRAFNLFFGLGIPAPLQREGYDGVLEPLGEFREKLLVIRDVDHVRCDRKGMNAHFDGASAAFTATAPDGEARAGGASIDQLVRAAAYPEGLPPGMVPTMVAGTFFRRSRVSRYVHSYREDGTVAATINERPRDLFDRVFGKLGNSPGMEGDARKQRLRRSVLVTVIDQYHHFTGANSPLGTASRSQLADHLERIREFEQRAYAMPERMEGAPERPGDSRIPHGGKADPGGEGIDITLDELTGEWRLMADLYALAIQLDRARFGALTFLAAGERIRLTGDYHYGGEKRYTFRDREIRKSGGSKGCSHEYWHGFSEDKSNEHLRMHAHMKMRELAYFLRQLDAPKESREVNGRSILENMLLTISTESGDGRHSDVKRELSGVFHAITGGNGRFKTGQIIDAGAEGLDVYNTMLGAYGSQKILGPKDREVQRFAPILA